MYVTELHAQVRQMTRQFANDVIRPVAEELDRDERFPAEVYAQMAQMGLFGICVPEAMGGPGMDTLAYAIVMEELSRGYASVADQCGLVELITTLLVAHGTQAQRDMWLPSILAAKTKVAYCITEPEAGTDVSGIRTAAIRDGEGWRLNGGKIWIHNAPVADLGFVLARTDPEAGHRGMSIFAVDLHADGVARGPKEHKMGQRASQVGPLHFDDVKLPAHALLGAEGRGFHMMMSVLDKGRVGIAALRSGSVRLVLTPRWNTQHSADNSTRRSRNFRGCSGCLRISPKTWRRRDCSPIRRPIKSTSARMRPRPVPWQSVLPVTWRLHVLLMRCRFSEAQATSRGLRWNGCIAMQRSPRFTRGQTRFNA